MRFDEPRHLTALRYRRLIDDFWAGFVVCGVMFSTTVLAVLYRQAMAGRHIPDWKWVGAIAIGPFVVVLFGCAGRLTGATERRWIELQDERVRFGKSGSIKCKRVLRWSLTPDKRDPKQVQLKVTYKFGLGRNHWTMLLNDAAEIAKLRDALVARFPELPPKKTK